MLVMPATELEATKVNKLEFMLAKTQFEIIRAKYLSTNKAKVQFLSYKNGNYEQEWENKLKELGYSVQLLGTDELGVLSYEVSWG